MAATLFGDARMVDLLLKRGADPNKGDASGATALMWAVSDIDKVRLLLARGADVKAKSNTERTALLVAAAFPGTVDVLRLLLDRGADVRAQDRSGTTALAFAVRSSDVDVVRLLVDRGLDPNALSPLARRAAFVRHDLPTTNYLMSKKLGPTPDVLMAASMWQPAPLVGRWIELGADVNQSAPPAQYARTALLTAVTSEAAGRRRAADPARAWRRPERADDRRGVGAGLGDLQRRPREDPAARAARRHPWRRSTASGDPAAARQAARPTQEPPSAEAWRGCSKSRRNSANRRAASPVITMPCRRWRRLRRGRRASGSTSSRRGRMSTTCWRSSGPRAADDAERRGGRRRGHDCRVRPDGAGGRGPSARHGHRRDHALAARAADAGRPMAGQRRRSAAVRIQHDQPHGACGGRAEGVPAPGPEGGDS